MWESVSKVRNRIVRETGIIPCWPGKNRLIEIRKSLHVYFDNGDSGIKLLASEKVIEIIKIYNSTCKNVISGALGYSIDESLVGKGL